ncbi:Rhodanese-like domain-containing protein [Lentinula aff. detonsa]|uniref:Rhodanese-like domain-containing protein n=1 Tax=Lentinula aff. detonsa TaxID=2804958 RepID=A0AA38NIW4_9AGAR|nr:Rhodanese-like domain-containing protein [Lentinula aff. detonsa]KAJ3795565.1 Rhodanese-like domain-containing protein [Lentinula aff. detonsa]
MTGYISRDELAEIIRSGKTPKKDYLVVDVRDDDYAGGNIVGGVNMPSNKFLMNVDQLVKETRDVPLVIFHCALSQLRGPKAARIYKETRQNVLSETDSTSPTKVLILRDGFTGFQDKFKDDAILVENWDKDVWASDWS